MLAPNCYLLRFSFILILHLPFTCVAALSVIYTHVYIKYIVIIVYHHYHMNQNANRTVKLGRLHIQMCRLVLSDVQNTNASTQCICRPSP